MELTAKILTALQNAVRDTGSVYALSKVLGVRNTTVRSWLIGETKTISRDSWGRVLHAIRPYLSDADYRAYATEYNRTSNEFISDVIAKSVSRDVSPVEPDTGKFFPIISDAAAACVNTLYYPLSEYAIENSDGTQYFANGKPGDFVIRVSGNSMLPWYPAGTLLLVRPNQRLKNGNRVIAILDSGEVVFKVFVEKGGKCGLLSINEDDGVNFIFEGCDRQNIRDIYKVVGSARDEEQLDRQMSERGLNHHWEDVIKNW